MSVILEVLEELWSMFVGDRRLTLLLLVLVAVVGVAAWKFGAPPLACGAVLLVGALAVLTDAVFQARRKLKG